MGQQYNLNSSRVLRGDPHVHFPARRALLVFKLPKQRLLVLPRYQRVSGHHAYTTETLQLHVKKTKSVMLLYSTRSSNG